MKTAGDLYLVLTGTGAGKLHVVVGETDYDNGATTYYDTLCGCETLGFDRYGTTEDITCASCLQKYDGGIERKTKKGSE